MDKIQESITSNVKWLWIFIQGSVKRSQSPNFVYVSRKKIIAIEM